MIFIIKYLAKVMFTLYLKQTYLTINKIQIRKFSKSIETENMSFYLMYIANTQSMAL